MIFLRGDLITYVVLDEDTVRAMPERLPGFFGTPSVDPCTYKPVRSR